MVCAQQENIQEASRIKNDNEEIIKVINETKMKLKKNK